MKCSQREVDFSSGHLELLPSNWSRVTSFSQHLRGRVWRDFQRIWLTLNVLALEDLMAFMSIVKKGKAVLITQRQMCSSRRPLAPTKARFFLRCASTRPRPACCFEPLPHEEKHLHTPLSGQSQFLKSGLILLKSSVPRDAFPRDFGCEAQMHLLHRLRRHHHAPG